MSGVTFDSKEQKIQDERVIYARKEEKKKRERKKKKKQLSLCEEGGDCGITMKTRKYSPKMTSEKKGF